MFICENKCACLQARMEPSDPESMETCCNWQCASGIKNEKQGPGEEPGQKCTPEPAHGARGVTAKWLRGQPWRLCTCGAAGIN